MIFKVGSKIQWKWLGRSIDGVVKEVHHESISRVIKGKTIKRNGSKEIPAYLVESDAGNLALKLQSELQAPASKKSKSKKIKPTLFGED